MCGLARSQPGGPSAVWQDLRARTAQHAISLRAPAAPGPGLCGVCWAPVGPGYTRCFQCELHAESVPGGLAAVVVPIAYSVNGIGLARDLWLYKSARDVAPAARSALRALLLVFLRDHGRCVRRKAGASLLQLHTMTRVATYTRQSNEHQNGITRQGEDAEALATARGWEVIY